MTTITRHLAAVASIALVVGSCGGTPSGDSPAPGSGSPSISSAATPSGSSAALPSPSQAAPTPGQPSAKASIGAWQAAAPMLVGRTGFDAVVLGDGRVLAVGDDFACHPGGAAPGSERAELYDPSADAWVAVESLNKPRKTPATVVLPDGSATVLGGLNTDDVGFSSTKVFVPSAQTWSDGPLLSIARAQPLAVTLADGRIFVVSAAGTRNSTSSEIYDQATATWAPAASLPPDTGLDDIVALNGGNVLGLGFDVGDSDPFAVAFVYDPKADAWTKVDAPQQFFYSLVALPDGGALVIGGLDGGDLLGGQGGMTAQVSRFDPSSGRWAVAAPLSAPRVAGQAVTLADGRVLMAGGRTGSLDELEGQTLRTTEIYDPATDSWTAGPDLLEPRKDGHALALPDGTILVLGGDDDYNTAGETPWCPDPFTSVERLVPPG